MPHARPFIQMQMLVVGRIRNQVKGPGNGPPEAANITRQVRPVTALALQSQSPIKRDCLAKAGTILRTSSKVPSAVMRPPSRNRS